MARQVVALPVERRAVLEVCKMADIFKNILRSAAETAVKHSGMGEERRNRQLFDLQKEESKSRMSLNRARESYYRFQAVMQGLSDEDTVDLLTKVRKMVEPEYDSLTGEAIRQPDPRLAEIGESIIRKIQEARRAPARTGGGLSSFFQRMPMQEGGFQRIPSISSGTATKIPRPKTREEWQALPEGMVFIDPNGVRRVK